MSKPNMPTLQQYLDQHYGAQLDDFNAVSFQSCCSYGIRVDHPLRRLQFNTFISNGVNPEHSVVQPSPNGFDFSSPEAELEIAEDERRSAEDLERLKGIAADLNEHNTFIDDIGRDMYDQTFEVLTEANSLNFCSEDAQASLVYNAAVRMMIHCKSQDFFDGNHRTAILVFLCDLAAHGVWLEEQSAVYQLYLLVGCRQKAANWSAADLDLSVATSAISEVVSLISSLVKTHAKFEARPAAFCRAEISDDSDDTDDSIGWDDEDTAVTESDEQVKFDFARFTAIANIVKSIPYVRVTLDAMAAAKSNGNTATDLDDEIRGLTTYGNSYQHKPLDGTLDIATIPALAKFRETHWVQGSVHLFLHLYADRQ